MWLFFLNVKQWHDFPLLNHWYFLHNNTGLNGPAKKYLKINKRIKGIKLQTEFTDLT